MAQALRVPEASPLCCRVCGCDRLTTDIVDRGRDCAPLLLAECPRCDHRYTEALPDLRRPAAVRPSLRVLREGASAA
jgi:hypothetical protein